MSRVQLWTGSCLVGLVLLFALLGPFFSLKDPYQQDLAMTLVPPGADFRMGSDNLGRSVYSRLADGARYSLSLAFLVVSVAGISGLALGIAAGYRGGWVDVVIMRLADLALAFPGILLATVLAGLLGGNLSTLVFALAAVMWCDYCRIARNITRSVKDSAYMEAGELLGFGSFFLARKYIAPRVLPHIGMLASLSMGRTIISISGLGFLGIGLRPPIPEWGGMISEGIPYLAEAPWVVAAPGLLIFITVLGFQLLAGEAVPGARR